eukprot:6191416-Pleurochrysis_carterae.AAC.4
MLASALESGLSLVRHFALVDVPELVQLFSNSASNLNEVCMQGGSRCMLDRRAVIFMCTPALHAWIRAQCSPMRSSRDACSSCVVPAPLCRGSTTVPPQRNQ